MVITSKTNSVITETKKLKQSKYRKKEGLFIAEGEKNVYDSLKYTSAVKIFHTENTAIPNGCENCAYTVSESVMKELCDTVTPQGIIGIFKTPVFSYEKVDGAIAVLNGVSDPGNVGTILRTALAMNFKTVICDEKTADVFSPKVVRSAMSAVFALNILRTEELKKEIISFKEKGYSVYAGALSGESVEINKIDFEKKCILVMGNEANGVSDEILSVTDKKFIIPMPGGIESLNVAVAAGISMYQAKFGK